MKFCGTVTCDECPWLTTAEPGRFPSERFAQLRATVDQGFAKPIFACHKTPEGEEQACVGYLLVDGFNNFQVRLAAMQGRFDPKTLRATGPLYESYAAMEHANRPGCTVKKEG